jgi:hypothetical protein
MPQPEDLAYAAAIIDGEGCISLALCGTCYHAAVSVTMRHPDVVDWLYETFGGFRYTTENKYGEMHRWELRNKACKPFLELVKSRLRLKSKQAEVVLMFVATMGKQGGDSRSKRLTLEDEDLRARLFIVMKKLNEKRKAS